MKVFYTVSYEDYVEIDTSDISYVWNKHKEEYDNDLDSLIYITVQEESECWRGLAISSSNPELDKFIRSIKK